jgi:hypothetical protein
MNAALRISYLVLLIAFSSELFAQQSEKKAAAKNNKNTPWIKQYIGVNASFPFGEFSATHFSGMGASYTITLNRENDILNWAFDAGVTYYFGKKETISRYNYKYPGLAIIHVMGGVHFWALNNTRLLAGPALMLYNGNSKLVICSRLETNFEKGRFFLGPVLQMNIEPGTRSLWSAGMKIIYLL